MTLEITQNNDRFYLKGNLNSTSCSSIKNQVNTFLKKHSNVVININEVTEIDSFAVNFIVNLFKKASNKNKYVNFEGFGAKDIYEELIFRSML